jgi:hypothetical protein
MAPSNLFTEQPEAGSPDLPPRQSQGNAAVTREQDQENRIGLAGLRSVSLSGATPRKRARTAVPDKEIRVELGDLLPRIPSHFLKPGPHDLTHQIRFRAHHLFYGLSRGRVTATLSSIAGRCPSVFRVPIGYAEDVDVQLPLAKIVEQIGELPDRADQMAAPKLRSDSAFARVALEKEPEPEQIAQAESLVEQGGNGNLREQSETPASANATLSSSAEEAPVPSSNAEPAPDAAMDHNDLEAEASVGTQTSEGRDGSPSRPAGDPESEIRSLLTETLQSLPQKLASGELKAESTSIRIELPPETLRRFQSMQDESEDPERHEHVSPVEEAGVEVAPIDPTLISPVPSDEPHQDTEQPQPRTPDTQPMPPDTNSNNAFSKTSERNQAPPSLFEGQPPMQRIESPPPQIEPHRGFSLTRQDLNHDQILQSISNMSGVIACIITSKNRLTLTGEIPPEFDIQKFRESSPDLLRWMDAFAGPMRLGRVRLITLSCDSHLASFAAQGDVCLCILHQDQGFLPGVREKLRALFEGSPSYA